jgi:hypothetical protein
MLVMASNSTHTARQPCHCCICSMEHLTPCRKVRNDLPDKTALLILQVQYSRVKVLQRRPAQPSSYRIITSFTGNVLRIVSRGLCYYSMAGRRMRQVHAQHMDDAVVFRSGHILRLLEPHEVNPCAQIQRKGPPVE